MLIFFLFIFQTPSPLNASSASQLPGNRKDANTVPKGKGRQPAAGSRASSSSGVAGPVKSSARAADPYDSSDDELRDDPLYAPPGKTNTACAAIHDHVIFSHTVSNLLALVVYNIFMHITCYMHVF